MKSVEDRLAVVETKVNFLLVINAGILIMAVSKYLGI